MDLLYTPYIIPLVAVVPVGALLAWQGLRRRGVPGATSLIVIALTASVWSLANALEIATVSLEGKILWTNVQYMFIALMPVAWLTLAIEYTGRKAWITRGRLVGLAVIPFVTSVLSWTNDLHGLMRQNVQIDTSGPFPALARDFGPWFWVHSAYSYLLIFIAVVFLVGSLRSLPRVYHSQPVVLLGGLALPLAWNIAYVFRVGPLPVHDFTPALFTLGGVVVAWGLFRFRLFSLVPVARESLVDGIGDGLVVTDPDGRVVDINVQAQEIFGVTARSILGRPFAEIWQPWAELADLSAEDSSAEVTVGEGDAARAYEARVTPVTNRDHVFGKTLLLHDITDRKRMEDALRRQVLTDALTGLPNRTRFMDRLTEAVANARRNPDYLFALVALDLDRFKLVNDGIGHLAGDFVLEATAARLRTCTRAVDTVCRLGGDEFAILLHDIKGPRNIFPVVERIQAQLNDPISFRDRDINTTASIGVVVYTSELDGASELLRAADTAMYEAKEAGRACYRIFDQEMHRSTLETMRVETELREAIQSNRFVLLYQPVVDVAKRRVVSLEALLRWRQSRGSLVTPDHFIPIAESTGLIVPLGTLLLDGVCAQLSKLKSEDPASTQIPISVNISSRQLTDTDFLGTVLQSTSEWRVAPQNLVLEVTETALLRDPLKAQEVMQQLREYGFRLCLDDFGSGLAPLNHLSQFPLQELKMDRALVARLTSGSRDRSVVKAVIGLAHSVGLVVTAKGVERPDQLDILTELGCDRAQGFLFAEPMLPDEATAYVAPLLRTAEVPA